MCSMVALRRLVILVEFATCVSVIPSMGCRRNTESGANKSAEPVQPSIEVSKMSTDQLVKALKEECNQWLYEPRVGMEFPSERYNAVAHELLSRGPKSCAALEQLAEHYRVVDLARTDEAKRKGKYHREGSDTVFDDDLATNTYVVYMKINYLSERCR